ncbi:uracil-DNA glycosylase [Ideonella dechloratans]|nr:uracil-DNA glycosylase [Ideonella dechloratans]UFU09619.1 uracil-DNA glycosylase [Ideonella dechloratans]
MPWTERQQALLQGMGLRIWSPPPAALRPAAPQAAPAIVPLAVQAPVEAPTPAVTQGGEPAPAHPVVSARTPPAAPAAAAVPPPSAPSPQAAGVAAMDWPALREAVAGCQACALCESRRNTVFGVGHPSAEWMIVGEAPGEQEDKQGEPFVGAAGQLLDAMLQAVGLTRSEADAAHQVFIANTLKCRPPRNRNPQPEELAQCAPFLHRQIALVRPKVLLAMGRFAIQQLLGRDEPIGRLRGQVHDYHGTPVIVTYHPAYLLRQPTEKAKAWEDLCLAVSVYRQRQG